MNIVLALFIVIVLVYALFVIARLRRELSASRTLIDASDVAARHWQGLYERAAGEITLSHVFSVVREGERLRARVPSEIWLHPLTVNRLGVEGPSVTPVFHPDGPLGHLSEFVGTKVHVDPDLPQNAVIAFGVDLTREIPPDVRDVEMLRFSPRFTDQPRTGLPTLRAEALAMSICRKIRDDTDGYVSPTVIDVRPDLTDEEVSLLRGAAS